MSSSLIQRGLIAVLLIPATLAAQGRGRGGGGGAPQPIDTNPDVSWRSIGPGTAGRMVAIAGSVGHPSEYFFGTTGGGVWKTSDGGVTTVPVTDDYFGGTIGAIAVAESNPDIVYVGGGETPIRGDVSYGDGMWKSTDDGKTWQYIGLKETEQIGRVVIDPKDPNIVYVAAFGHVYAPNPERGIYKTTDGGAHWTKVLFRNDSTGAIDIVMDPSNSSVLYAAFWQAGRKPWQLVSGGVGSGIFKTTDGGAHWTEITRNPGMPKAPELIGNIGISVSPVNTNLVWALIEAEPDGGLYKSDDGGATWKFVSGDRNIRQRAWYYMRVFADQKDTNTVYAPNVGNMVSHDGGITWGQTSNGDSHNMWLAPDGKRMGVVHDNGAIITVDGSWHPGGTTQWTNTQRIEAATGQFYHVHLTDEIDYEVCGAKQDSGAFCGPVRETAGRGGGAGGRGGFGGGGGGGAGATGGAGGGRGGRGGGAGAAAPPDPNGYSTFHNVGSGESGFVASDPLNPAITYAGEYSGVVEKRDGDKNTTVRVDPWPLNPMGHDAQDSKYRIQWTFPIMNSPFDPHVIYVGSNVLFKSSDDGTSWSVISPDLTKHDPATLGASGGPITKDQTSVEYYGTIFAVQESPLVKGMIWSGSDDGLVYLKRPGVEGWKNVTPPGMGSWTRISGIEPSPHNPGTAYVAANRYQMDDFAPYLYKTTDYGVTWTKITNGIPGNEFTRAIREDLVRPGLLYAATERSMYVSYDAGKNWSSLKRNLPPVPVHDIALRDNDMVIATHGRGFWVMEHLDKLRYMPEDKAAAGKDYLYHPAIQYRENGTAEIHYALAQAGQPVTIDVIDPAGKLFKRFATTDTAPTPSACGGGGRGRAGGGGGGGGGGRGGRGGGFGAGPAHPPNAAGQNYYSLDLRYPGAVTFCGMLLWEGSTGGPTAAPGNYTIRLKVGNNPPLATTLTLKVNPQAHATDADITDQVNFALQVRDRFSDCNNGVRTIRNIRRQLEDPSRDMAGTASFAKLSKSFLDSLSTVEDSLYQTKNQASEDMLNFPIRLNNEYAALLGFVLGTERKTPQQARDVYAVLAPRFQAQMARLKYITDVMVPRVNVALKAAGKPVIVPSTEDAPVAAGRDGRGGH
ncbi:MAG TPA: glycosyl hydrolase [Gemmatimonadaceae bacterium]|nr:glycosyl hydrolase [Gemmatimonadaceae bacterium]